ncbi:MAG: hypothetical protein HYU41_28345 [Candidatus Rokubacteria bacterium]|nr:hypothetical protein [Candidatus Rokubacteria bacterium]
MSELVLRGGRVIDGTGREPIADAGIVIEGDRITQVDRTDRLRAGRDARVVDLDGRTIMPGLVDLHTGFTTMDPAEDIGVLRDKRRIVQILQAGRDVPLSADRGVLGADFVVADAMKRESLP